MVTAHNQYSRGTMKLVFGFVILLIINIEAVNVDVVYGDGAHQRLYFRGYDLVCPKLVQVDDSYSNKELLLITFANVKFVHLSKRKEFRQNHKHSHQVSFYKIQLIDSTGEIIKFNTIQPLLGEYAPFYIYLDCNQIQNCLTIHISDNRKSNLVNIFKQPFITNTQRELHSKKDPKTSKSSSYGSSGNIKTLRVLRRSRKLNRPIKKSTNVASIKKLIKKLKTIIKKKQK